MELSGSEDDFVVLSLLEKGKYCFYLILKKRQEQEEFHLLIKELWNYPDHFQVYFRMSVVQFDMLLAVLEPHIKKETTNFR